jgi:hypothetical protein
MIVLFNEHREYRFWKDPEGRPLHWTAKETEGTFPADYIFFAMDRDHAVTTLAVELFSEDPDDEPMDRKAARKLFEKGGFVVHWLN